MAAIIGTLYLSAGFTLAADASESDSSTPDSETASQIPQDLIESMAQAVSSLNYEGTFVHAQGMRMTTMQILHSTHEKGELERLTSLDGEEREVIRNNSLVTCIWPDSRSVVVSKSKPRDLLPQIDASLVDDNRYRFSMGMADRVAGRETHVVEVESRDEFRYGYRFWIDTETSMLLRSMLLDGPDNPVEQIIFTSISYPETIDVTRFEIATDKATNSWLEPKKAQSEALQEDNSDDSDEIADKVAFSGLPEGYREVSETYSPMPIQDGPVSHVMLTDGMASVSVYVEYVELANQSNTMLGLSSMGAMNAYGVSSVNAVITAVGEVPAATVKAIALAVTLKE